jgi:hypothetical protein
MANFVTNSTGTAAIRKSDVVSLEIVSVTSGNGNPVTTYNLQIKLNMLHANNITFETATTLEGIQARRQLF